MTLSEEFFSLSQEVLPWYRAWVPVITDCYLVALRVALIITIKWLDSQPYILELCWVDWDENLLYPEFPEAPFAWNCHYVVLCKEWPEAPIRLYDPLVGFWVSVDEYRRGLFPNQKIFIKTLYRYWLGGRITKEVNELLT